MIGGWMAPVELAGLYDLCQSILKKGDLALEVGSWKGRSSFVIASVCAEKEARLTCIDTFTGPELSLSDNQEAREMGAVDFFRTFIAKNLAGLPVNYIINNSLAAHKFIKNGSLAFCFIDGDHRSPVIEQDLKNFWPKVKKGGLFCGHDYNAGWPDVARAVNWICPDLTKMVLYGSVWSFKK